MSLSAKQKRDLQERQVRLSALTKHASWPELKAEFERRKDAQHKHLVADLMGSEPVNQRKLDWYRGFWAGCAWLLKNPDMAEASLNTAMKAASEAEEEDVA